MQVLGQNALDYLSDHIAGKNSKPQITDHADLTLSKKNSIDLLKQKSTAIKTKVLDEDMIAHK